VGLSSYLDISRLGISRPTRTRCFERRACPKTRITTFLPFTPAFEWQPATSRYKINEMPDRTRARALADEYIRKGDPTGWFEPLYREGASGKSSVPWVDLCPNPYLLGFWHSHPQETAGKSALVIGSALGDDPEQLAAWGFHTTAFDISETAIRTTLKRYPNTKVKYLTADLLSPPPSLHRNFDFVFEANTLQVLPPDLRPGAIENIARFLCPGGLLLVIARGREPSDPEGQMPWPLTRVELSAFKSAGLEELSFEDLLHLEDPSEPPVRRFRVLYRAKSV
jgi:SAM-dependent methyltransferase